MRIGELSTRTGVPIPTIKYYLREGLLDPGTLRASNQADYSEHHVQRLRLVRALIDVGGVPVAAARDVVAAIGRSDLPPHDLLGVAHEAVTPARHPDRATSDWARAREEARQFVTDRDWQVSPDCAGLDMLADVLATLRALDVSEILATLDDYADAAAGLAGVEVDNVIARGDPTRMLELVVLGTVLGEALFAAMRLLAHQDASARRLAASPGPARS